MTLTIQLPRDLAAQISALPEAERQAFAVAALREAAKRRAAPPENSPLTEEDHQAIAEALSDLDEDRARTRPASEFFDELARKHSRTLSTPGSRR